MRNNRWLVTRTLALFAVAVPLAGCFPGCGPLGLLGLIVKSEDPQGHGIPETRVAVVPMPCGGVAEVQRHLQNHEPVTGWLVSADAQGVAKLDALLSGKEAIAAPQNYAYDPAARGYTAVTAATACAPSEPEPEPLSPQATLDEYAANGQLCVFAEAPGYQPYVGVLKIERSGGKVRNVELKTVQGRKPKLSRKGATLTLQPVTPAE